MRWFLFPMCVAVSAAPLALSPRHPELLREAVLEAYHSGAHRITVPAGVYRIQPAQGDSHLQFVDLSDFEIDARGAAFVFTDQTRGGIEFRRCHNLRFRGATIAYETPPFTQAVIEEIGPDGAWYLARVEPGYPINLDNPKYFAPHFMAHIFDGRTRLLKAGTYDLTAAKVEPAGPQRFRIYWGGPSGPALHPVSVGDLIAIRGAGFHNLTVIESSRVEIFDVTIYNAGIFAIWESGGEGENHYTVTVKPGPSPKGARTSPLLSSTADAFHSTNVRKGPVVENSRFEGMGDDAIAIHGTYSLVFEASGNRLTINRNSFRPGDPLRLLDLEQRPAGQAVVESVRALPDFVNTRKSARKTKDDNTGGPYFEVVLDRPLRADFDYLASNPAASGSGYILRRNHIANHRARGMLLKADDGVVEANIIDGSSMAAIELSPEVWWNEASYSHNVVIRGNTIRNVAYAPGQRGAVVIANTENPVDGCGHQRISIQQNIFESQMGPNLYIDSACGMTVTGNRFTSGVERHGRP